MNENGLPLQYAIETYITESSGWLRLNPIYSDLELAYERYNEKVEEGDTTFRLIEITIKVIEKHEEIIMQ